MGAGGSGAAFDAGGAACVFTDALFRTGGGVCRARRTGAGRFGTGEGSRGGSRTTAGSGTGGRGCGSGGGEAGEGASTIADGSSAGAGAGASAAGSAGSSGAGRVGGEASGVGSGARSSRTASGITSGGGCGAATRRNTSATAPACRPSTITRHVAQRRAGATPVLPWTPATVVKALPGFRPAPPAQASGSPRRATGSAPP